MKTILLSLTFSDPTGKFWWDSSVKNKTVVFDPEKETIHNVIKGICDDEGMELTYKGKPQGNIYRDLKDGGHEIVGYLYRGKGEVHDRNMVKAKMVFWEIWSTIKLIEKFEFEEID